MSSKNEELLDNKYSLKKSTIPGTFFHNLPYVERISTISDKKEIVNVDGFIEKKINHLKDEEMSEGWRLVLPNFIMRKVNNNVESVNNVERKYRRYWKFHKFSVHIGQIPYHLMHRVKNVYKDNKKIGYYVRNKIYEYNVYMTDVDNEIIKLAKVLHTPCPRKHVVKDLVDKINSANVKYGWVLLKANKFLAN